MDKIIIVDNLEENYRETTFNNGIKITTWIDSMEDRALEILSNFLKKIVLKRVEDVRILLGNFKPEVERSLEEGKQIPDFSTQDVTQA